MVTTKMKRAWFALIAIVAALALGFTLSGCAGESDEELITKAIDNEMSIIVEPDDETIQMLADEATAGAGSTFETMGIDSAELVKSWIDGFGYSIGTITVDGDTATVEMTITSKQLGPVMMDWQANFEENATSQGFTSMDEIYAYAGETIMDELNNASPVETTVEVAVNKDGNDWVFDQGAGNQTALMDAMIGDYYSLKLRQELKV